MMLWVKTTCPPNRGVSACALCHAGFLGPKILLGDVGMGSCIQDLDKEIIISKWLGTRESISMSCKLYHPDGQQTIFAKAMGTINKDNSTGGSLLGSPISGHYQIL